jgi:hypothetical protein
LCTTEIPTRRVQIENSDELLEQRTIVIYPGDNSVSDSMLSAISDASILLVYGHFPDLAQAALRVAPPTTITAVDVQDIDEPGLAGELMSRAVWTFISEPSAKWLTGAVESDAIVRCLWSLGATNIVLKMGPGGALIVTSEGAIIEAPAFLGPFNDSVGAGDVFNAVFLCGLNSGYSHAEAASNAAIAASYFVAVPGYRFASPSDLGEHASNYVASYSPPEKRLTTAVRILRSDIGHQRSLDTLCEILGNHSFYVLDDSSLDTFPQDLVVQIGSAGVSVLNGFSARGDAPVIVWDPEADSGIQRVSGTIVIRDAAALLMCLYGFAGGGATQLDRVLETFREE